MERDHGLSPGLADRVAVKAAVDAMALIDESRQPARIGSGPGGGEASMLWMESQTTDGIDGRLDQDNAWLRVWRDGEQAQVLLGAGGQPTPRASGGPAQFSAHGLFFFSKEQENGIGPVVGVKGARLDERFDQGLGKGSLTEQIPPDAPELGRIWRGDA